MKTSAVAALLAALAACAASSDNPGPGQGEDDGLGIYSGPPPECGALSACGRECKDLSSDPTSCGACERTCIIANATAACRQGECVIAACHDGYYDTDRNVDTGCELRSHCAAGLDCQTLCDSSGRISCNSGISVCTPPAETCNARDDNCNGQCDEGAIPGCRIGVHRSVSPGYHLYTTDLGAAMTAPYMIEGANYFRIYAGEAPRLVPVFLCQKPNGRFFLTSSSICESLNIPGRQLGYWSAEARCGAQPLYRLYHEVSTDHLFTLSEMEAQSAVETYGYRLEGVPAYVWLAP
jgi:hypothetical protein